MKIIKISENQLEECLDVIHKSFATVAVYCGIYGMRYMLKCNKSRLKTRCQAAFCTKLQK